jgi:hypothetical protein
MRERLYLAPNGLGRCVSQCLFIEAKQKWVGQALCMSLADIDSQSLSIRRAVSRSVHPGRAPNHQRRRATATPNKNVINSEPRGASRAILLKMLNGIAGLRRASIASLTRWTVLSQLRKLPRWWISVLQRDPSLRRRKGPVGCHKSRFNLQANKQLINQSVNCSDMAI